MNRDYASGEWPAPIDLAREANFQLGRLEVRPSSCEVELNEVHSVEPRVMQVLVALMRREGLVVSRDDLIQSCWGGRVVGDDAINRCIAKARRLGALDDFESFEIDTIPRVGYRLRSKVQPDAETPPPIPAGGHPLQNPPAHELPFRNWRWIGALIAISAIAVFGILLRSKPVSESQTGRAAVTAFSNPRESPSPGLPAGAVFSDCPHDCPQMVVIHPGYFMMGASRMEIAAIPKDAPIVYANEAPQHEVLVAHRFALARYDVTRQDFARFVADTGRPDPTSCYTVTRTGTLVETIGASWRNPGFQQTARDPAVCISWNDANAYALWLSRKTGKPYRLPSEAEWEYAARGGQDQQAPAIENPCRSLNGADADYHQAYPGDSHYDSSCHDGFAETSPVGSFPGNRVGLFDMLGNAGQLMADCYHPTYDGAPVDGSAWLAANCAMRTARGGYWAGDSRYLRVSARGSTIPDDHFSANGFRVARDLAAN